MARRESAAWRKARRALETLKKQFFDHPTVRMIDIGAGDDTIVLRIHVTEAWMKASPEDRISFPEQVDGIPVKVVPAVDYRPE